MQLAGFYSRSYYDAERNYSTHDKEMLAIVDCLKKWEPQLTGLRFETLTDHASLTHWKTQKNLTPRQIRWNEYLSRFDTDIHHILGISNSTADALSRYPYVQNSAINAVSIMEFNDEVLESVRQGYTQDSLFGPVIKNPERYPAYQYDDGLLFHDERLCIPAQSRLAKERLLTQYHDDSTHLGIKKTYDAIRVFYFWPSLLQDTKDFVQSCRSCARNKSTTQAPAGFLHSMPVPARRFEELAIDFISPLTKSKGFNMLLVMIDCLTNYVRIESTKNNCTAKEIAELMYYSWYRIFGLPTAITSDRDKLFTSKFWDELHKQMNIHLRMSIAYHLETDGSSERSNKTVIEALRHYTNTRQTD
jgi:hypothetical protein